MLIHYKHISVLVLLYQYIVLSFVLFYIKRLNNSLYILLCAFKNKCILFFIEMKKEILCCNLFVLKFQAIECKQLYIFLLLSK